MRRVGPWKKLAHRLGTVAELVACMGRRRPWILPVILGLLLVAGAVCLAQATHIAPFLYTLF